LVPATVFFVEDPQTNAQIPPPLPPHGWLGWQENPSNNGINVTHEIWHMKIPLKIKIFMWYLKREVILTKDNLAQRN
jgi:hypothetical protein